MLEPLPDLIEACTQGDGAAQARFFTRFKPILDRSVGYELYKRGIRPQAHIDPEDIVNDVFTHLFADQCRRLSALREAKCIDAWLMTIARNRVLDTLRRAIRFETAVNAAEENTDDYTVAENNADTQHDVEKVFETLEPLDKVILNLYFIEELTYAEVASALGMNANTVSSRLRRARTKLRENAERFGYERR